MLRVIFLFLVTVQNLWANPFAPYFDLQEKKIENYYLQTPPFQNPVQQDSHFNSYELNLNKLEKDLSGIKLDGLENIYKSFQYNSTLNLYEYDFAIGTNWENLPYPIIKSIGAQDPKNWIEHFEDKYNASKKLQTIDFIKGMNTVSRSKAYAGNQLELLKSPYSYQKIIEKIQNSKNHAFMSTFLFQCDAGSERLLKTMEKKIQEGLKIYLIIDSTFTLADRSCVKKLRNIGVNLGLQGSLGKVFHEKMYVFDGEYAIVDGHNIVAAQTLSNGSNNLINDTGVGTTGPMVSEIAQRFIYHWQTLLKKPLPESILHFYDELKVTNEKFSQDEYLQDALQKKQGLCRLVTNTPGGNKSILETYKAYVQNAKSYIFFNMIDLRFEKKLGNSVGIDFLRLVTEKANQNPQMRIDMLSNHWKLPTDIALPKGLAAHPTLFSQLITKPGQLILDRPHLQISKGRKFLSEILHEDNFHWWASAIYVHSKTMMIDNIITAIGSYNINPTSENSSYEQTLICHDENLAQQMQKSILHDVLNSIPIFIK